MDRQGWSRRKFLGTTASAGLAIVAAPHVARAAKHELLVAEPVHSTGYLPMYIAMANGYFAEADIEVKIVTIETGGGHTNAAGAVVPGRLHDLIEPVLAPCRELLRRTA